MKNILKISMLLKSIMILGMITIILFQKEILKAFNMYTTDNFSIPVVYIIIIILELLLYICAIVLIKKGIKTEKSKIREIIAIVLIIVIPRIINVFLNYITKFQLVGYEILDNYMLYTIMSYWKSLLICDSNNILLIIVASLSIGKKMIVNKDKNEF